MVPFDASVESSGKDPGLFRSTDFMRLRFLQLHEIGRNKMAKQATMFDSVQTGLA
jgi:hypothetical protein